MALTGNKGEWSEIYAHFKLLADGELCSAASSNQSIDKLFFPILQILRSEKEHGDYVYTINKAAKQIEISGGDSALEISQQRFSEMADLLYDSIKSAKSSSKGNEALTFPLVEDFMNSVEMYRLKAVSADKKDIRMVVHDLRTHMTYNQGFSIKSKLGGQSTLVNANGNGTNFKYKVYGVLTDEQIATFNSTRLFSDKFRLLREWGCILSYVRVVNDTFYNNLTYIDSSLHVILAKCLEAVFSASVDSRHTPCVLKYVSEKNPCNFDLSSGMDFYEHKFKQFLLTFALGMKPNTPWSGVYDANGGYIVIKEDGDIICYHFYDRNQLEDYLFENTSFDTPSTSRHLFGDLERDGSDVFLKLNVQIRFIHNK